MRSASVCILFCLVLFCPNYHASASADTAKPTPLILEKNEGERRIWRPVEGLGPQPENFILKIDPQNGGSKHLLLGTEDLTPGAKIEMHKHPGSRNDRLFPRAPARAPERALTWLN